MFNKNQYYIFIKLLLLLCIIKINGEATRSYYQFEIDKKINDRINSGRESLELIKKNSISNRCLEECMDILSNGCKDMDDLSKSRLAVKLTNCHLAKSGHQQYPCRYDMSIQDCTSKMDQMSFVTYTNFYISTENICYYLSQEIFQQRTEQSINNLVSNTQKTQTVISSLHSKANDITEQVDISLNNQKKLLQNQKQLIDGLDNSVIAINDIEKKSIEIEQSIKIQSKQQKQLIDSHDQLSKHYHDQSKQSLELINEIKHSSETMNQQQKQSLDKQNHLIQLQTQSIQFIETIEQITDTSLSKLKQLITFQDHLLDGNKIIITILNQLNLLQNWILSEVIDFKSIFFYISIFIAIYLISSTKRTKSTRVPLLIGLIVDIFVERSICSLVLSSSSTSTLFTVLSILFNIPIIKFIRENYLLFLNSNATSTTSTIPINEFSNLFSNLNMGQGIPSKENIYHMINNIRSIFIVYSLIILFSSFWFYKDYERENHQMLVTILKTVKKSEKKYNNLKNLLYEKGLLDKNDKKSKDHSSVEITKLIDPVDNN
ncbi:hypothetical protein RB653_008263 [Dictyostelium firmibasis]|uniref:Uncharacterized protein n=1 Tax=Dictyostelium firmibasis TaxID=79012 RepID=A0AAN7TZR0_9MYCE